jgi:hypothetical protein
MPSRIRAGLIRKAIYEVYSRRGSEEYAQSKTNNFLRRCGCNFLRRCECKDDDEMVDKDLLNDVVYSALDAGCEEEFFPRLKQLEEEEDE